MENRRAPGPIRRFFSVHVFEPFLSLGSMFRESTRTLSTVRGLTLTSMLIALYIVLSFVARIDLGPTLRITFSFLAVATAGMLLGPVPAMLTAGISDILMCLIRPSGPYFPGFTVTAMLGGLVYGLFLYRRDVYLFNIILAKVIVNIAVNILFNSINLQILYGNVTAVILLQRVLKNVAQLPVDIALMAMILPAINTVAKRAVRIS